MFPYEAFFSKTMFWVCKELVPVLPFGICPCTSILYSSDSITTKLIRHKTSISYHSCCIMPLPRISLSIIVTWILSSWWILISCRVIVVLVRSRKTGLVIRIFGLVIWRGCFIKKMWTWKEKCYLRTPVLVGFAHHFCAS